MNYKVTYSDEYLSHHGILGMKWGVRNYQNKDGSLTEAGKVRYSSDQYKRDKSVYGRIGAKRIRKNVGKGDSVSGARSKEADRINRARNAAKVSGQVGGTIGLVGGAVGGYFASKYIQERLGTSVSALSDPAVSMAVSGIVAAGMSKVGKTLGYRGGQSVAMLVSGYDPSKYR